MEARAVFKELTINTDGTANVIFRLSRHNAIELGKVCEEIQNSVNSGDFDGKQAFPIEITAKKFRKRRSTDANAYMWELIDKLAEALSTEGNAVTRQEIYRKYIKEYGIFRDIEICNEGVKTLAYSWGLSGLGYLSETLESGEKMSIVRLYYGSSCYNTKQMSRVIDAVVQDCKAVGIETKTPKEIAELLSLLGEK